MNFIKRIILRINRNKDFYNKIENLEKELSEHKEKSLEFLKLYREDFELISKRLNSLEKEIPLEFLKLYREDFEFISKRLKNIEKEEEFDIKEEEE